MRMPALDLRCAKSSGEQMWTYRELAGSRSVSGRRLWLSALLRAGSGVGSESTSRGAGVWAGKGLQRGGAGTGKGCHLRTKIKPVSQGVLGTKARQRLQVEACFYTPGLCSLPRTSLFLPGLIPSPSSPSLYHSFSLSCHLSLPPSSFLTWEPRLTKL